jgi:iron complex outermembrane recepter protein
MPRAYLSLALFAVAQRWGIMRKIWTSALAVGAAMGWSAAYAQSAGDEIIVTVQKREQALTEVPVAVSAVSGAFMDQVGIDKFDELALFVPGLEIQEQSPNNAGFVIRGITSDSGEATVEPRVAVFQDGVSISRNRGSYVELFDMERIEVARGPQATLFGRGALIGGINLIQNRADASGFEGAGSLALGGDGYARVFGAVNFPIVTDVLAVRVAATLRERDGFVENTLGGEDLRGVRLRAARISVSFDPTENVSFDLILNGQQDRNSGTAFKSGTFAPPGGTVSPYSAAALNLSSPGFEGGTEIGLVRDVGSVTLIGEWQITPALTLTSTTGFRYFDSTEVFDPDGFQYPAFLFVEDAVGRQYSQEFRINYDNGGPITAFAGVSWLEENGRQRVPLQFDERAVLLLLANQVSRPNPAPFEQAANPFVLAAILQGLGVPGMFAPTVANSLKPTHREQFTNFGETTAWDFYGDVTWAVSERFELSAGVRFTQDEKTSGFQSTLLNGGSVLGGVLAGNPFLTTRGLFTQPTQNGARFEQDGDFSDWTYRVVARYEFSDDLSIWGSFARGRRPEVIAPRAPTVQGTAPAFSVLPAETVDSIELGAKGRILGGDLSYDVSVYFYQYENFQTTEFNGTQIVTINAGEASAEGFEAAVFYAPTANFDLFGTYAYSHARFDVGARNGNSFRLAPDHSLSFGGTYRRALPGNAGSLFFTPTYTWQSEVFFDDDNDRADLQVRSPAAFSDTRVDERQDSYGLLNLRAGYEPVGGGWRIEAFATNALDEEYIIDAGNTGDSFGIPTFIRGAPRLVGVELSADF